MTENIKTDNKILNNNAVKNPVTSKPSTSWSANKIMHALITKRNNPKVIMVAGKVKKIKSGRTNIFRSDITTATIIEDT